MLNRNKLCLISLLIFFANNLLLSQAIGIDNYQHYDIKKQNISSSPKVVSIVPTNDISYDSDIVIKNARVSFKTVEKDIEDYRLTYAWFFTVMIVLYNIGVSAL
jgi:hypothetical protein